MAAQGVIGFLAWPALSPNPFGVGQYKLVILVVFIPSFLFYRFPYVQRKNDKYRTNFLNKVLAHDPSVDIPAAYARYDADKDGKLDRSEARVLVHDMFVSLGVRKPTQPEVDSVLDMLFSRIDLKGDGYLEMDEFQHLASDPSFYARCEDIVSSIRSGDSVSPILQRSYSLHDQQ